MLRREIAEDAVLAGIKREMSSPDVIREICKRFRAAAKAPKAPPVNNQARVDQLRREIWNIAEAIASVVMRASPTLALRLADTEAELERIQSAEPPAVHRSIDVSRIVAELPRAALRAVESLERTLASGDIPRARSEIRDRVGTVTLEADECEIRL